MSLSSEATLGCQTGFPTSQTLQLTDLQLFIKAINICFWSVFQIKDYGLLDDEKEAEEETQAGDEEGIIGTDETI